jgi:hypothetical protein
LVVPGRGSHGHAAAESTRVRRRGQPPEGRTRTGEYGAARVRDRLRAPSRRSRGPVARTENDARPDGEARFSPSPHCCDGRQAVARAAGRSTRAVGTRAIRLAVWIQPDVRPPREAPTGGELTRFSGCRPLGPDLLSLCRSSPVGDVPA